MAKSSSNRSQKKEFCMLNQFNSFDIPVHYSVMDFSMLLIINDMSIYFVL